MTILQPQTQANGTTSGSNGRGSNAPAVHLERSTKAIGRLRPAMPCFPPASRRGDERLHELYGCLNIEMSPRGTARPSQPPCTWVHVVMAPSTSLSPSDLLLRLPATVWHEGRSPLAPGYPPRRPLTERTHWTAWSARDITTVANDPSGFPKDTAAGPTSAIPGTSRAVEVPEVPCRFVSGTWIFPSEGHWRQMIEINERISE